MMTAWDEKVAEKMIQCVVPIWYLEPEITWSKYTVINQAVQRGKEWVGEAIKVTEQKIRKTTQKNKRHWSKHSCLLSSCTTGNAGQPSYRGFPELIINIVTASLPVWPWYKRTPPQDLITVSRPKFYKGSISAASTKPQLQLKGNARSAKGTIYTRLSELSQHRSVITP